MVLVIYLILTSFSMFLRPDFLSLTAVALGIYATENPQNIKRSLFRMLVAFVMVTFVFDLVFLLFIHSSDADDEESGGTVTNVRRFAYFFAWISFFFRPIVIAVLWKDSLDFRTIVRHRGKNDSMVAGNTNQGQSNPELELARVMAQFGTSV